MHLDLQIANSLNNWAQNHASLISFLAVDSVYIAIAIATGWLLVHTKTSASGTADWMVSTVKIGLIEFAMPIGFATLVSEIISAIYIRQRPFAAHQNIHPLISHAADGGLPSHHAVFMLALSLVVLARSRKTGFLLMAITALCAFARVSAGVHYPTDIVAAVIVALLAILIIKPGVKWLRSLSFFHDARF
jgi:membrane-associated phospholipid phosphatase